MYTQLAPNQVAALAHGVCAKCGGQLASLPGRTGPTVRCPQGHKVNRPRGKGFSKSNPNPESSEGRLQAQQQGAPNQPQSGNGEPSQGKQQAEQLASWGVQNPSQSRTHKGKGRGQAQQQQETQQEGPQSPPQHPQFDEIWRRLRAGFRTLLLVGPSGSGKTTLFYKVAAQLAAEEGHKVEPRLLSFTSGLTEGKLIGFSDIHGHYVPGFFVAPYEQGGVFGADEFDAADANVVLSLNAAVENGHLSLPSRVDAPTANRHKSFCFIGMANTYGWGADIRYVGRNQLDASTLSRFAGAVVKVDYDQALETRLTPDAQSFREAFWGMRNNVAKHKLRRVWGTRELLAGARLLRAGYDQAQVLPILTAGWTDDEVHKLKGGA